MKISTPKFSYFLTSTFFLLVLSAFFSVPARRKYVSQLGDLIVMFKIRKRKWIQNAESTKLKGEAFSSMEWYSQEL